eukprot:TRINITY_DN5015_c0_g1_i1.p1 TRINITY_DN5015_c0_g1~~TRINITY_DN5015_c0_g1_i1.p1  ORF type:complete len:160 (+),score=79.41 TRINITY_DN5015_c0_g1_i1:73-552(+)
MPHSFGMRARTRNIFARPFREHGQVRTSTYLQVFKKGEFVDVKANGAVHKGMPHRFYHGKTGKVWNVTPRAIGVEVNKRVGNRIIKKRIHVRVEHVQKSKCQQEFKRRVAQNIRKRTYSEKTGVKVTMKRKPTLPRRGGIVKTDGAIENFAPIKYELLM